MTLGKSKNNEGEARKNTKNIKLESLPHRRLWDNLAAGDEKTMAFMEW